MEVSYTVVMGDCLLEGLWWCCGAEGGAGLVAGDLN